MKSSRLMHANWWVVVFLAATFGVVPEWRAQEGAGHVSAGEAQRSLSAIAGKRRALLVVSRMNVLDVGDRERSVIEQAFRADPRHNHRHRLAYASIAIKLNEYIRKYHSMAAVQRLDDAEYVIFFNLLEYRFPLGTPYPYGELFVIVKDERNSPEHARIVWKSEKVEWAGDAVKSLIKQLRLSKGED